MKNKDFKKWENEIKECTNLETNKECIRFCDLMESLEGNEGEAFIALLIDNVKQNEDHSIYESLYNALWRFPESDIGRVLANKLPDFQKRMGKYDQVSRFLIPLSTKKNALNYFLKTAKNWNTSQKRIVFSAIRKWNAEDEFWEFLLRKLGVKVTVNKEDAIPDYWSNDWKHLLEKGRNEDGEFCISQLLWRGGKKQWLEDLDFLIEMLELNHGKHWRQVDNMTNPLFGYAKKSVYPIFIERVKKITVHKQNKILENVKKVSKPKYKQLSNDINGSE